MDDLLKRLPARPQPLWVQFAAATAIMALCIVVQAAVAWMSRLPGLFILLAGIFICAIAYERVAGIYASVLATAAAVFAVGRLYPEAPGGLAVVGFFSVALGISFFADALRASLERAYKAERDKDMLFRELAHRMLNNFSVAISLLEQQGRTHDNAEVRSALANAGDRLRILAEGQRHLQPLSPGLVEMRGYLAQICDHLAGSLGAARPIEFVLRLEPVTVDAGKALALALITNELVTNALKHAFVERNKGVITVALAQTPGSRIELAVSDDGVGFSGGASEGFGSKLVQGLSAQYGGIVVRKGAPPGCRVQVTIPGEQAASAG